MPTDRNVNLAVMILVGCGKTDATALMGKGKAYVFFDLAKLFEQKRTHNVEGVFLVHELLHGIHYFLSPNFGPPASSARATVC